MPLYIEYPSWITPEIIPGLPLRWYGLMYIVAFTLTYLLCRRQARTEPQLNINDDDLMNLTFWTILSLLIGARLFAGIFYDPSGRLVSQPWLIFWPFDEAGNFVGLQGMSFHGGLTGAVVGVIIYCRIKGLSILRVGDMIATAVPLGYTFGRLGNFLNRELYGRVTTSWFGMRFPGARSFPASETWVQETAEETGITITDTMVNLPRHPSQLYEAFLEGILLFLILWFIFRPRKPFQGFMIGLYLIGYGIVRFLAEYTREPDYDIGYVLDLSGQNPAPYLFETPLAISKGQVFCLLMIAGGLLLWGFLYIYHKHRPRVKTYQRTSSPPDPGNASRNLRKKLRR